MKLKLKNIQVLKDQKLSVNILMLKSQVKSLILKTLFLLLQVYNLRAKVLVEVEATHNYYKQLNYFKKISQNVWI